MGVMKQDDRAASMSGFAVKAPLPMLWGALAPLVTDVHCMEHREELIPSFTLVCGRKDRFVIHCYLFG